jgi:hypothetical protein
MIAIGKDIPETTHLPKMPPTKKSLNLKLRSSCAELTWQPLRKNQQREPDFWKQFSPTRQSSNHSRSDGERQSTSPDTTILKMSIYNNTDSLERKSSI